MICGKVVGQIAEDFPSEEGLLTAPPFALTYNERKVIVQSIVKEQCYGENKQVNISIPALMEVFPGEVFKLYVTRWMWSDKGLKFETQLPRTTVEN